MDRLRQDGHDVLYVAEMGRGISDEVVLDVANRQDAVLITADLGFGDMVLRQRRFTAGVLLVRLPELSPELTANVISTVVREHPAELAGNLAVLTPGGLRVRRVTQ